MTRSFTKMTILLSALALAGACGDDDSPRTDVGLDTNPVDVLIDGMEDTGTDSGMMDSGTDSGMMDSGTDTAMDTQQDAGPNQASQQIANVIAATPGAQSPALPIEGAWVTYTRGAIGSDPEGFFVQADMMGPALYVAVEASVASPAVGDTVTFNVDETTDSNGQLRATMISGFMVTASGADVSTLVQDVSTATDLVTALGDYASELVTATGTLGESRFAGSAHSQFAFATAGLPSDENLSLRVPDSVIEASGAAQGCTVTAGPAPMWRFRNAAQVSAFQASELMLSGCPELAVVSAAGMDEMNFTVEFSAAVDPATVMAADFTVDGGITVDSVSVSGTTATITTSNAMTSGTTYTVTVADVNAANGAGINAAMNSAMFMGVASASVPTPGTLVITEIMYDPNAGAEWVEVYNSSTETLELMGCELDDDPAGGASPQTVNVSLRVDAGNYLILGAGESGGTLAWSPGLNNGGDQVEIRCNGMIIDNVNYGASGFPMGDGVSIQLTSTIRDAAMNDDGSNWCATPMEAMFSYGSMGLFGSPGRANANCNGGSTDPMPMFTAYLEGSGNNKALQITNLGGMDLDLSTCMLRRYTNASTTSTEITLTGTLAAGAAFEICNNRISDSSFCDAMSGSIAHNGDDSYELVCAGVVQDSFGQTGVAGHPDFQGTNSMGNALSAANMTLLRICGVAADTDVTDAFDLGAQWDSTNPTNPAMSEDDFMGFAMGYNCP